MAAMMGWPVELLYRSTLPEVYFAYRGFLRGRGADVDGTDGPMTRAEFDELCEQYPDEVPDGAKD